MRAAATGLIAIAALAMPARADHGRVVRVDRPRASSRSAPRLCQLSVRDLHGQCYGRAPAIGELATAIDDAGILAELRVVSVRETRDPCGNISLWDVGYEVVRGDAGTRASYLTLSLFDLPVSPRARLIANPGELTALGGPSWAQTWSAIDRDGDGSADFALVGYTCERDGTPQPGARDAFCAEYWLADGGRWTRQRVDVTPVCF
jgi:hypothetical protein